MGTRSLLVGSDVDQWHVPMPLLAIVGPLRGLGYIIALPFIGIAAFSIAGGYYATQSLVSMWRRPTKTPADTQERVRGDVVGVRDFLPSLVDRLECELAIVDREFRITQYSTSVLRQNKLLEQTAIGQHCYEVSHGRDRPCESYEYECPVKKVLETNQAVMVTHYHENRLEGKRKKRLVKVLASPVRDSQGNVTHVAELIWDADSVK